MSIDRQNRTTPQVSQEATALGLGATYLVIALGASLHRCGIEFPSKWALPLLLLALGGYGVHHLWSQPRRKPE